MRRDGGRNGMRLGKEVQLLDYSASEIFDRTRLMNDNFRLESIDRADCSNRKRDARR